MLVLTRRTNQSIKIGDDIEITVIEVRGDQVRLGITAPRDIAVHRKEIYLQIQQENVKAARNVTEAGDMTAAIETMLQPTESHASSEAASLAGK